MALVGAGTMVATMSIVYFILLLGGLIFFHELGHFLVARWMGVHVVTFSIGFGPKLFGFQGKQPADPTLSPTEYVVAALPLGALVSPPILEFPLVLWRLTPVPACGKNEAA